MKSDEIVTGSVSGVGLEAEQTPDAEVKDTEGQRAPEDLTGGGVEGVAAEEAGVEPAENVSGSPEISGASPQYAGRIAKPNLSREQQEWLNKVFIPNFRKELMRQIHFDRKVLDEHKRQIERRKKEEEAQKRALQAAQEENEKLLATISEVKVDKALIAAAGANGAVNPDQVRKLLKDRARLGEDLEPMVLDENGERQLNRDGEFMTVEEQVRLFLAENPHLVKSGSAKGGSGSSGSGRTSRGFAVEPTTSGDLIAEGLVEESRSHPTRTLGDFDEG